MTSPSTPPIRSHNVCQLETARGSAIALFGLEALRVPALRAGQENNDLLVLWSDVWLTGMHRLSPARHTYPLHRPPLVKLDERYYGMIDDLRRRCGILIDARR